MNHQTLALLELQHNRNGLENDSAKGYCKNMGTAYADQMDLIHGKATEIHDFINYCTRKSGGEVDEIKRSKKPRRIKDQSQSRAHLCGNQTTEGLNESAPMWFGQARTPAGNLRPWH